LCSCKTCNSFHERGFNTLPQGNFKGGGVVLQIVEVLTTLEQMGSKPILEQVLLKHNAISLGVMPDVHEMRELINGTME